jgi:hypothetical protein
MFSSQHLMPIRNNGKISLESSYVEELEKSGRIDIWEIK